MATQWFNTPVLQLVSLPQRVPLKCGLSLWIHVTFYKSQFTPCQTPSCRRRVRTQSNQILLSVWGSPRQILCGLYVTFYKSHFTPSVKHQDKSSPSLLPLPFFKIKIVNSPSRCNVCMPPYFCRKSRKRPCWGSNTSDQWLQFSKSSRSGQLCRHARAASLVWLPRIPTSRLPQTDPLNVHKCCVLS